MSRLKIIDYRTMDGLLRALGFVLVRQKGSHIRYKHPDGRTCTVPRHDRGDLNRPLIRSILREIKLTPDQYHKLLENL
jgi:predicted RNA binding protein YcfA (HicA-like mRNA interferase family)